MSRNDEEDDLVSRMGFGSLGGEGIDHHNTVKSGITAEGAQHKLRCDNCNQTLVVTVPWPELIFMSQGLLPTNGSWKHDGFHGAFLVAQGCPRCKDDIRLATTPDECKRNLDSGIAAQKISREQIVAFIQQNMAPRR